MYWLRDHTDRYKNYARYKVRDAIEEQMAIYGTHSKLVEIEKLIRG